jgi:hypothetical protein
MFPWEEAKQSIRGVVRIAKLDPDALEDFNLSIEGYWRSFFAALLLLPLFVIAEMQTGNTGVAAKVTVERRVLIEAINYPLAWALWPLLSFYLVKGLGREDKYLAYITGSMLLLTILLGLIAPGSGGLLLLMLYVLILVYECWIARSILGVPWLQAAGIETLIFMLAVLLGTMKDAVMLAGQ